MSNAMVTEPKRRNLALERVAAVDVVISLVVAFNFAVTQPLLDLLGRNAPFFIAHDLVSGQIVGIALLLAAIIPLGIAGILLAVRQLFPRFAMTIHLAILAALVGALALSVIGRLFPFPDPALIATAVLLGVLGAFAYARLGPIQTFVRFCSVGPVAFLLFFLIASPVSALIRDGGGMPEAEAGTIGSPAPVVVIMLDEFPLASIMDQEGGIDGSRYPNFARLADQSTWYRNTTTVHTLTTFALPSMLTGEFPRSSSRLPIARDHPRNLFQRLANSYEMVAIEPVSNFCVYESCISAVGEETSADNLSATVADLGVVYGHIVLPPRLRSTLPDIDGQWAGFIGAAGGEPQVPSNLGSSAHAEEEAPTPDRTELVAEHRGRFEEVPKADKLAPFDKFLSSFRTRAKPTLYFGHFMLPHSPWVYLPSGDRHTDELRPLPGREDAKRWGADEWLVAHAYRLHLLQAQLTDRMLGRVLDRLQEEDLFEQSLVVVVSDHGTTFQVEERRRSTTREALGEVAYVPFFVKTPGQSVGEVSDSPTQTIDMLPTIMDVLESDQSQTIDGRSVLTAEASPRTTFEIHNGSRVEEYPTDGQALREAVDRKYDTFPLAESPKALFRFGPFGDMVGKETDRFQTVADSSVTVQIPRAELPANIAPSSGLVPALVRGIVHLDDPGEPEPTFLALSLDETISAIAKTYVDGDGTVRFETLLDPGYLESGSNSLDVYQIDGGPDGAKLTRLPLEVL